MKIVALNGSPRLHGNTRAGLEEIIRGMQENVEDANTEIINITTKKVLGCVNCNSCHKNGGVCVLKDDAEEILKEVVEADCLIFGTPVYWWGMTAQMKSVIDRFYSKGSAFRGKKKKIALFMDGAADLDDPQYRIIREQMECITNHIGWDIFYVKGVQTSDMDSIKNNSEIKEELYNCYKAL